MGIRDLRKLAGETATQFVEEGMTLGIGSGSTARFFIDSLGERYKNRLIKDILTVPTSNASAELAEYGIPIVSLSEYPVLDLAVDGADEVDPCLNLIKGLGGALLREKIVEIHAKQLLIIVDETKIVSKLGSTSPLPVEILTFETMSHVTWLKSICTKADLWLDENGAPIVTENGNNLARMWFDGGIPDAYELASQLNQRPGIVEHGLFLDMATKVIIAGEKGVRYMEREHEN